MKNDVLDFDYNLSETETLLARVNFTTEREFDDARAVDSFELFTDEGAEVLVVPEASAMVRGQWWSAALRVALAAQVF